MRTSHRLSVALLSAVSGMLLVTASAAAGWFPLGEGPKAWRPIGPPLAGQRLVVLGDSVPAGTGCGCAAFPTILARDAARWSGRPAPAYDEATGGLTAGSSPAARAPRRALRAALGHATLVSMTVGANDLDPSLATALAGARQHRLLRRRARRAAVLAARRAGRGAVLGAVRHDRCDGYWNVFLSGAVGRQQGATYVRISDALTRQVNSELAARPGASGPATSTSSRRSAVTGTPMTPTCSRPTGTTQTLAGTASSPPRWSGLRAGGRRPAADPGAARGVGMLSPAPRGRPRALVAQRIEHLTTDQEVAGSNPAERTQ